MKKTSTNQPKTEKNWIFLPVHKQRIIKELAKAVLIRIDYDRSTILPNVFKRTKETKDYIFFSLPEDFNANIRVSTLNEKTRRFEHKDYAVNVSKLLDECGLDKSLSTDEEKTEEEFVGENAQPEDEELPF